MPRRSASAVFAFALVSAIGLALVPATRAWNSALVPVSANGRLSYVADADGNRLPDFSHAGYRGGGIALPAGVPVVKTLAPTTGDNTARIQVALDEVAALPLRSDGYRGTLQLAAGVYEIVGTLRLNQSGVVLKGAGPGDDPAANTILRRTGTSQAAIIQAGNRDDQFKGEIAGSRSSITTTRVQVGARSFEVDHPEYYHVGDAVIVWHPSTPAWIDAVDRGGVTDANFWKPGEIDLRYHRYITAVTGSMLTVDAPVFNHLDRSLAQSTVYRYDRSHVLTRLGVEQLQVDIVTNGELTEDHAEDAITFVGAEDSWIRDCTMKHFWHAGVQFEGSTRCTVERCRAIEPHGPITGGYRYNFSTYHAQLILFRDCFASYARHAYVCNGTSLDAGNVFLNSVIDHAYTSSEGHRRWSTGLLYDNLTSTARQSTDVLGLYNRGTYGTGHGWAAAHSVAWNCNASGGRIWIQKPPTAQNYGIGCSGNVTGSGPFAGPAGFIEGTGQSGLEPRSLYLAQLAQRLADSGPPVITAAPTAHTIAPGDTAVFSVMATGAGLDYQWSHDGVPLADANAATLVIPNVAAADAGVYTVTVSGAGGPSASAAASLAVVATDNPGRLVNLAIRSAAGTGAQTLIIGATVGGTAGGRQPLLLRAVGPSLAPFGVRGVLADPMLTLYSGTAMLATNDDWRGDPTISGAATELGAFAFSTANSKDAALLPTGLAPGSYSMQITAASGTSGVALGEIYDATAPSAVGAAAPRLTNLSARTQVGTDASILIAGFTLGGTTSKTVLIRAIGPGLTPFGVGGLLLDPRLELFSGPTLIAANDDWAAAPWLHAAFSQAGAFSLDAASRDAALLVTLAPGSYTAQVSGPGNTTGVALVEVYALTP